MITIGEEHIHSDATDLLHKSVAFTRSLYPIEEHAHSFNLKELKQGRFFIVRHEGNAIGCGAFVWYDACTAELRHIFIEPAARGLGCGKALVKHIEQAARDDGARRIILETTKKQVEAIRLYEGLGYSYREPYTKHHRESVFMEKAIDEATIERKLSAVERSPIKE